MYAIRSYYAIVVVAGAIGGALNGLFQAKLTAFAFHSVLSIPVFTPVIEYSIGIGTGFGLAFLFTLMFGIEHKPAGKSNTVVAKTESVTAS